MCPARNLLLRRSVVRSDAGEAIVDQAPRLERVDHVHDFLAALSFLFILERVTPPVEEERADGAVVGHQLAQLALHVVEVLHVVCVRVGKAVEPVGMLLGTEGVQRRVFRIVPVLDRVIDAELYALAGTLRGQFFQRIAAKRGGLDDVVGAQFRVVHREAFMMLGRDHQVLHARRFSDRDPGPRVEFHGIELGGEFLILGAGDVFVELNPFAARRHGVQPPVNEHPESGLLKPAQALGAGEPGVPFFGRPSLSLFLYRLKPGLQHCG